MSSSLFAHEPPNFAMAAGHRGAWIPVDMQVLSQQYVLCEQHVNSACSGTADGSFQSTIFVGDDKRFARKFAGAISVNVQTCLTCWASTWKSVCFPRMAGNLRMSHSAVTRHIKRTSDISNAESHVSSSAASAASDHDAQHPIALARRRRCRRQKHAAAAVARRIAPACPRCSVWLPAAAPGPLAAQAAATVA